MKKTEISEAKQLIIKDCIFNNFAAELRSGVKKNGWKDGKLEGENWEERKTRKWTYFFIITSE